MNGSTERRQVLDMLAAGTISAEEADRLLEKLETSGEGQKEEDGARRRPSILRILVEGDGEHVNVGIPIGFVKAGLKLGAMLPDWAQVRMQANGIDIAELIRQQGDDLDTILSELDITVEDAQEHVRIFTE